MASFGRFHPFSVHNPFAPTFPLQDPFTRAWRWEPAATVVQSWMSLMRNEIPALVVHFCRGWASLAFPMANRAARQRLRLQSCNPFNFTVPQSPSPSIAYFGLSNGSQAHRILHLPGFSITCSLCSSKALASRLRGVLPWAFLSHNPYPRLQIPQPVRLFFSPSL